MKKIKKLIKIFFFLGFVGIVSIITLFLYYAKDLPKPESISERKLIESTKIFDRSGEVLFYDIHGEEKRTIIAFENIPNHMKNATIVAEDDDFYHHIGFDPKAILRAFISNIRNRQVSQGGSTITQQFIKNALLSPERTYVRKIKEAILAIEVEVLYTKDEILGFYLNQIPYGSNAYGVEAAAQTYFAKSAKDLSLAEAALIASLPNAPTYYSPYGSHPEELESRQAYILDRMVRFGYANEEEVQQAKEENLVFKKNVQAIQAPHFVMYVREYLEETYGKEFVQQAGFRVITSVDAELQLKAEELVKQHGERIKEAYGAQNAALIAIDPKTGQILAMVGSVDYFDLGNDGNVNVTTRLRQPGSSFKPFVYAQAFEKEYTPETIVFDVETEFALGGSPSYKPQNYDEKFRGPISFRDALAQSLNVPSVKVLYLAGVTDTIKTAKKMGISSLNEPSRYGLSLVLGGGEVSLLDETTAFGVFGQDGVYRPAISILKIETNKGEVLEEFEEQEGEEVLSPRVARLISSILSDDAARTPTFGAGSVLTIPGVQVAAKTGTTQEFRDAWTVGFTPTIAVGVWAGNNDNTPMTGKAAGSNVAGPLWNEFTKFAIEKLGTELFKEPDPEDPPQKAILAGDYVFTSEVRFDKASGKIATKFTPPWMVEKRIIKEIHSILHWVDKSDPRGSLPKTLDSQYGNWEEGVLAWIESPENKDLLPEEIRDKNYDDLHTPEKKPSVTILSSDFASSSIIFVQLLVSAPLGIEQIDFFLGSSFIGSRTYYSTNVINSTLSFSFPLSHIQNIEPNETLYIKLYDKAGNLTQTTRSVYFSN